jgi:hypothetical protein
MARFELTPAGQCPFCRQLDCFEEHQIGNEPELVVKSAHYYQTVHGTLEIEDRLVSIDGQNMNWRNVEDLPPGFRPTTDTGLPVNGCSWGIGRCLDCGSNHELPGLGSAGLPLPLVCPLLPWPEAQKRARGRVRLMLARAKGHHNAYAEPILRQAADEIESWVRLGWGRAIHAEYVDDERLRGFLLREQPKDWRSLPLTVDGPTLAQHLPLVRSLAERRSLGNHSLCEELDAVGWEALEECARNFDPKRHRTFGVYARKRVDGAMMNYIRRERPHIRTVSMTWKAKPGDVGRQEDWSITMDGSGGVPPEAFVGDSRRPKRDRTSSGGFRDDSYVATEARAAKAAPATHNLAGADPDATLRIMKRARLNDRQWTVYQGRFLDKPPKTRAELAAMLEINHPSQITAILHQAIRKVESAKRVLPP